MVVDSSVELERLVAKIQQDLAPNAEVLHNVMLDGRSSGRKRQIDVLVREHIGQYEISIIIDCKDYKRPVDVKGVEEFWGLFEDVGAQKGVLVCPSGFTASAKARAQDLQIDLYSPIDTDLHKWKVRITMPAICDYRGAAMGFGLSMSAPYPFQCSQTFYRDTKIYNSEDEPRGTAFQAAIAKWNEAGFPIEPGEYERLPIFETLGVRMDNGYGKIVPVEIWTSLYVTQELYFGQYPIRKVTGFKDEIRGGLITNAFQIGMIDPDTVINQWKRIDTIEDAPVKPVFTLRGLVGWDADEGA